MGKTAEEIAKALKAPFPAKDVEWRIQVANEQKGIGLVLAYIDNRAIQDRLDESVGIENWKNEFVRWGDSAVLCGISIKIGDEWITKWDGADETDRESTKGGLSNSMKRAAYQWGIGRYLYDLPPQWVKIEKKGKTWVIAQTPKLPSWAVPEGDTSASKTESFTECGHRPTTECGHGPTTECGQGLSETDGDGRFRRGSGGNSASQTLRCSRCGASIPQAVSVFSRKKYGEELCMKCQQEAQAAANE